VLNRIKVLAARLLNRAGVIAPAKIDLRSFGPIHVCTCGSKLFKVGCMFEDNDISLWFTSAECSECGALVTVPTPVDYSNGCEWLNLFIYLLPCSQQS